MTGISNNIIMENTLLGHVAHLQNNPSPQNLQNIPKSVDLDHVMLFTERFTHIFQDYFTGIVRWGGSEGGVQVSQCQWTEWILMTNFMPHFIMDVITFLVFTVVNH